MKLFKITKLLFTLFAVMVLLSISSCEKVIETSPEPKNTVVEISGDGGESTVELGAGDWKITGIINNEGNQRMFGDIRALDGTIISRNSLLELDGPGILTTATAQRGFTITQESSGTIEMLLDINLSGNPFSFKIVLENGGETYEILIKQTMSSGYRFENIEYFLDDGDGDSVYVRDKSATYQFDLLTPQDVDINPYNGPQVIVNSHFESEDDHAFSWLEGEPVAVPVPTGIVDEDIYVSGEKRLYGEISTEPYQSGVKVTVSLPAGKSSFSTSFKERIRTVSYRLTIKSKSNGETREVFGKWIEISPTEEYEISYQ